MAVLNSQCHSTCSFREPKSDPCCAAGDAQRARHLRFGALLLRCRGRHSRCRVMNASKAALAGNKASLLDVTLEFENATSTCGYRQPFAQYGFLGS